VKQFGHVLYQNKILEIICLLAKKKKSPSVELPCISEAEMTESTQHKFFSITVTVSVQKINPQTGSAVD
jgi:hypothetical protein